MRTTVKEALARFDLIAGVGSEQKNQACAMSLLAWLDECDNWTDRPACAHPLVASWVITANDTDTTTPAMRARLVRLGLRGVLDTWWIPGVVLAESQRLTSDEIPSIYERIVAALSFLAEWKKNRSIPNLEGAYLAGANLEGAYLGAAYLAAANLRAANLEGAYLGGAYLGAAYLRWANLASAYLRAANLEGADLVAANLAEAYLAEADLEGADLVAADLRGAYLGRADLARANLEGANLREADLRGAYLGGADLARANLEGADLRGANLGAADLGEWKRGSDGYATKK